MSAIRQGTAECIRSFQTLSTALLAHDVVFRSMINVEALEDEQGRFRVWSGNLGALQKGHSSLDYRLRDSPLLQTNVLKLLNELRTNLSEALAVVLGDRLPYEQQPEPDESEDGDDVWSQDEDSGEDEAPKTELEQRFLDIVDIVDNLYKLSVRIRSPTLRSRSLKAASYRPVDPDTGIDTFEQYALFDLQHTRELLSHLRSDSSDQKSEENNYLIERLSKALTLRRRQFKYWRRHRDKLGTSSDIGDIRPKEVTEIGTPADKTTGGRALNVIKAPTSEWMPKSLLSGTEATQYHHSLDEVVDNQSVTSYATTTRDLTGRGIELPSPPKAATGERDFECPYCFIICPARYGKGRAWRTHILQDLQPYVCTHKDCKDSDQLFRSRREWSEHEAGHRKLWRCPEHINAVFRSSSGLEDHLHREHPGSFPEEQLSSIIRVGETSAIDLRQACPICFVAATIEGGLQNHIANHLERLAVFALPKDVDSTEDESNGASSAASRGRSVGSSASQHLISESSYSGSISRQSDNTAYLDSDLASKISRLTSETQALGSEAVPLKQEVTNALSANLLTLLPDASNQKMDIFLLSSQQHFRPSDDGPYQTAPEPRKYAPYPGSESIDYDFYVHPTFNEIDAVMKHLNEEVSDHLELQKQSTNGPEDADWPSTLLRQKGEDFDNVLPELPELQADRQQTLPNTFDSLAKDQHTENASGSGTDQEKFYYANELSDISDEVENAAQQLAAFADNIPNFEQEVIVVLSSIASMLEALGKFFTSSENPIRKFTGRTASDLDLLCTVLQSISKSVVEMTIQAKYTSVPTYKDFWDDFNFHLKNNQGLSVLSLLNLCMSFAGALSDILQNGAGNIHMGVMRDHLARYRLKQTSKDAEEAHNRIFEEVLLSREFTTQSIAEFHASDIVKASRIPNLNDLYRFGHLSKVPTNSKANPAANDIICLIRHDITRLGVDAIVNSTDRAFSSFGSLDKAIFKAGGPDMRKAISKFGICEDGSVRLTEGYQLPCKYVYHAIPPERYQSRGSSAEAFRKCYSNSLEMALEIAARTIAFPAIGAGLLGYPRFEAVSIAIEEVQKFLAQNKTRVIDKIIFCVFEEGDESMYQMLLPKYFPPVNDSLNMMEVPNLEVGGNSKGNETALIPIPGARPRQRTEPSENIKKSSNDEMTDELQTSGKERLDTAHSRDDLAISEAMVKYISETESLAIQQQRSELKIRDRPWGCCQCFARPMITENCLVCFHETCQDCGSYIPTGEAEVPMISLVPLFLPEVHANLPRNLYLRHGNTPQGHEEWTAASERDALDSKNRDLDQSSLKNFVKIHRAHLSLDTLIYYGLKWTIDKSDQEYIIVLHELGYTQLEYLFDHTRILRKALRPATSTLRLRLDDAICLGDGPGWWNYPLNFGLPVFEGSNRYYSKQSKISVTKPGAKTLLWIIEFGESEFETWLSWSSRESDFRNAQGKHMLYPGRILGFGRQDDGDTLPFLSLRAEFDGVEVSSETQVDIWEAARVRAHEYGFTLPPEDEQQCVHFSDETTHVPSASEGQDTLSPAKGILRQPTQKFPEDTNPIREGVAPLRDSKLGKRIPLEARWTKTKIDRRLVNPEALEEAKERFEERPDCVIVLRVLSKEEIQKLADRTEEIRIARKTANARAKQDQHAS